MKKVTTVFILLLVLISIFALGTLSGCGGGKEAPATPTPPLPPPPEPSKPDIEEPVPVNLVNYNGPIEHIFFREILAWPEAGWNSDRQHIFDSSYITADEFKKVLRELYRNDFVLINLNDVYIEYMTETGSYKMQQLTLEIPEGKKPLIMYFDNLNFREDYTQYGFMSKYVIGADGEIWAEGTGPDGNSVRAQDLTAVTLLEQFIRENPGFSHNGAKGCISLTGARGILGYKTQKVDEETEEDRIYRMREIALVTPVIDKLKENGWYFASHTYGGLTLSSAQLEQVQEDAERWQEEVAPLVGNTRILIYPSGHRLDGSDIKVPGPAMQYYVSIGFRYFGAIGSPRFSKIKSDDYSITAVIFDRASMSGESFRLHRNILDRFFDVKDVFDSRRPNLGDTWDDTPDTVPDPTLSPE